VQTALSHLLDAELAEKLDKKQNKAVKLPDDRFNTVIQYSAVGVVAAIIPWNYVRTPI
jgi:betaine-aldehyde dehydrogenase